MDNRPVLIFDEDYTGKRYTYGLVYRPLQIGAQPKGYIIGSLREHPDYRHGTIQYPQPLTSKELQSYELEICDD